MASFDERMASFDERKCFSVRMFSEKGEHFFPTGKVSAEVFSGLLPLGQFCSYAIFAFFCLGMLFQNYLHSF